MDMNNINVGDKITSLIEGEYYDEGDTGVVIEGSVG